ncbi:hypothetical protein AMD27_16215 (plasmid) [Acinetobacter sp. TGL-Y2]|uniref:hypothetical protein n=1 Tax=Acinetobacter sp. TGL-Y2 TaxID=1407071 RepID=UPI0007A65B85|nr:hypothetical protein [Acinetobacter sp. TGL-Y2]AMW80462.1 hypothetical protein AMD27_16215 [Acinetobacter sp. TGL-Y2]
MKALGCTLEGHELKYNSNLMPIIVSTAVKKDSDSYQQVFPSFMLRFLNLLKAIIGNRKLMKTGYIAKINF